MIIELDEYLNLNTESLNKEFTDMIDTIPKKYWNQFYSNASKFGNFDKNHPNIDLIRKKQFIYKIHYSDKEVLDSRGYLISSPYDRLRNKKDLDKFFLKNNFLISESKIIYKKGTDIKLAFKLKKS